VDYTGADGVSDMNELMSRLATQSSVPIMVDTTETKVARQALTWLGARPSSTRSTSKKATDRAPASTASCRSAAEFGAAIVATCIDEEDRRALRSGKSEPHGPSPTSPSIDTDSVPKIFIDALALPLSTGMVESRRDGIETIEAIRRIKAEMPGVRTILGLSMSRSDSTRPRDRCSTAVYLHECAEAGLDAAIVHASSCCRSRAVDEEARRVCLDLIYDRRSDDYDPLQVLLGLYEGSKTTNSSTGDPR